MLACDENDNNASQLSYPDYILAGETDISRFNEVAHYLVKPAPAILRNTDFFLLDFNQDGIDDFKLTRTAYDNQNMKAELEPLGESSFIANSEKINWVASLGLLDVVNADGNWNNETGLLYETDTQTGLFEDAFDQHIGLKTTVTGNTYYGWVKIAIASSWGHPVTIIEYATTIPFEN